MMTYQRITPWLGVGLNVIRPMSSFLSNCLVAATCLAATAHLLLADGSSLGRLDCESGHVRATAGIAWTANGVLSGQRVVRARGTVPMVTPPGRPTPPRPSQGCPTPSACR